MKERKGWIALDIDGTITVDKYSVPQAVVDCLGALAEKGWDIAMATGRPFSFASLALKNFSFPYTFLLQNGSVALEMPEKKFLFKRYISPEVLPRVEAAFLGIASDFLIYTGYEKGDFCYWRPDRLGARERLYLEELMERQKENWQAVSVFDPSQIAPFPLIKCFGSSSMMQTVAKRLLDTDLFQVARIRDPFTPGYELLLVTDREASKGQSLQAVFQLKGRGTYVIAAGDDENDLSLFDVADIRISMPHAPLHVQEKADLIAPPTKEMGIISALQKVCQNL